MILFGLCLFLVVHFVILPLIGLILVHSVVLVLRNLPSNGLIRVSSRLLLGLGAPVDGFHRHVVDPVVLVDVRLEKTAPDPPVHTMENKCFKVKV